MYNDRFVQADAQAKRPVSEHGHSYWPANAHTSFKGESMGGILVEGMGRMR